MPQLAPAAVLVVVRGIRPEGAVVGARFAGGRRLMVVGDVMGLPVVDDEEAVRGAGAPGEHAAVSPSVTSPTTATRVRAVAAVRLLITRTYAVTPTPDTRGWLTHAAYIAIIHRVLNE
ncbi:MAG TPA: hypothetical protein VGN19_03115 [Pedococcus sp.]|nr:hypothetical protein [Pedococcus sp.]